jgi:hypothetical protein
MNYRIFSLSLVAVACPLMQGCLTQTLWNKHYNQPLNVAIDILVEAIYANETPGEDGQTTLFLLYHPAPSKGEKPLLENPAPGSGGVIVFRAPELKIRNAVEALAKTNAGDKRVYGFLDTTTFGDSPGSVLSLLISPASVGAMTEGQIFSLHGTYTLAEIQDAGCVRVPLAQPIPLHVIDRYQQSDSILLFFATPFTCVVDVSTASFGFIAGMGFVFIEAIAKEKAEASYPKY